MTCVFTGFIVTWFFAASLVVGERDIAVQLPWSLAMISTRSFSYTDRLDLKERIRADLAPQWRPLTSRWCQGRYRNLVIVPWVLSERCWGTIRCPHFGKYSHHWILTMPVQLPLKPVGVNLPASPQDPPTFANVVAEKSFQTQVDVAVGQPLPLPVRLVELDGPCSVHASNAPTVDDSARADVYRTNVIMAHSVMGECLSMTSNILSFGQRPSTSSRVQGPTRNRGRQ